MAKEADLPFRYLKIVTRDTKRVTRKTRSGYPRRVVIPAKAKPEAGTPSHAAKERCRGGTRGSSLVSSRQSAEMTLGELSSPEGEAGGGDPVAYNETSQDPAPYS